MNPKGDLCKSFEQPPGLSTQTRMQPEKNKQSSFFDLAVQQRGGINRVLEMIAREVDLSPDDERVAATYSSGGWPACRVGLLLRVMILQHLYGPSDPRAKDSSRTGWGKILRGSSIWQSHLFCYKKCYPNGPLLPFVCSRTTGIGSDRSRHREK